MPTPLSQQRKREFERKLSKDFSSFSSEALDRYLEANFALYKYKPNISSVVKMISASAKGYGNCLGEGGYGVLLEETIRNFNHQRSLKHANIPASEHMFQGYCFAPHWVGNIAFTWIFDIALFRAVGDLNAEDFINSTQFPHLFIAKDRGDFGFVIVPYESESEQSINEYLSRRFSDARKDKYYDLDPVEFRINPEFKPTKLKYVSHVDVVFGSIDKLIDFLPERETHNRKAHYRWNEHTGEFRPVKSATVKNPIKLDLNPTDTVRDHIVYEARDQDGQLRYIGEGKSGREAHVNSGTSSNIEINRYYFTIGELAVKVLKTGLTKYEARSIERILIKRNSGPHLRNVKENEQSQMDLFLHQLQQDE